MKVSRGKRRLHVVHGGTAKTVPKTPPSRAYGMWITNTGNQVPISGMDNTHLCNTIFLLRRKWHTMMASVYEPAQDPPNPLKRRLMLEDARGPSALWPVYDELMHEALRRRVL